MHACLVCSNFYREARVIQNLTWDRALILISCIWVSKGTVKKGDLACQLEQQASTETSKINLFFRVTFMLIWSSTHSFQVPKNGHISLKYLVILRKEPIHITYQESLVTKMLLHGYQWINQFRINSDSNIPCKLCGQNGLNKPINRQKPIYNST